MLIPLLTTGCSHTNNSIQLNFESFNFKAKKILVLCSNNQKIITAERTQQASLWFTIQPNKITPHGEREESYATPPCLACATDSSCYWDNLQKAECISRMHLNIQTQLYIYMTIYTWKEIYEIITEASIILTAYILQLGTKAFIFQIYMDLFFIRKV